MEQDPPDEAESTWLDNSEPSAGDGPGVSRPGDSHRPRRSRKSGWSEWLWDNDSNRYYSCRVGASGTYEYKYYSELDTPRVVPESSSADYAPQELQLSSYPPLPSPLDGITEDVANSTLISPSSTRTYPQAQTREPPVDKEQLDPRFKVHGSWQFKVGKVFKVLWAEPRGDGGASVAGISVTNRPEKETVHSVRRFIIVNSMRGHCICLPIMTYNWQGTKKKVLPGENLTRKPIRIIPFTPRDKLETTSRLDYAKVYTIEFNVKVWFIGVIDDNSKDQLLKSFAEVQSLQVPCEPLSNSEPPSQPVHKVLDPAYQMASRKFFKKGRVFSTPHPEVAGPSTTDSNEITLDPYHNKLHTKIRRCIVVRDMSSHCLCVPVNTYGGRENHAPKPQDQRQLFPAVGNWDKSRIAKKELPLVVEGSGVDIDYNLASVDFTRILTIKHYALVKKIGRIDKLGLPLLEECFRNALGMPLELDDTNPAFVSMFSPTHGKWFGLIAGVQGDIEENFISRNVVDRLRLPAAPEAARQWANGVERPAVTATFTVAKDRTSQFCIFYVVDSLDYDVCFGRTFVKEHSDRYTRLYDMMYPSGGPYSNQLARPESSPYGVDLSAEEPHAENPWQEVRHGIHARKGMESTSSAQYDDIYDDN